MRVVTVEAIAESRFLNLRGLRFHYLDWGNAGAQPLLLLHGFSSDAHQWNDLAVAMRERFHVIALDQRGHGETEWATEYRHEQMAEDVEAFRRALGLERFALLGLSMGGRVAYQYAAAHLRVVERLVIVDIGPDIARSGLERIRAFASGQDTFEDHDEAFRHLRAANPRPSDETLRHRVRHGLIATSDGRWTWRYDKSLRTGERSIVPLDPEAAWSLLARVACPTLLVRGAESDILTRETAERVVSTIPRCRLVEVPGAGHAVPRDDPQGFLAAVRDFLLESAAATAR